MKVTYPHYYHDFKCIASACKDCCCIGWEIDIDENTYANYEAEPGDFGKRLRENISKEETPHFLLKGERCPFLNEKNLCDIILTIGEPSLCEICTEHPRFHEWFGDVKESGLGLCCEAAARLILQDERPASFHVIENDEEPASDFYEEELKLFHALVPVREFLLAVLQNRKYTIGDRLAAALIFAEEIQGCMDGGIDENEGNDENIFANIERITAKYAENPECLFDRVLRYPAQKDENNTIAQNDPHITMLYAEILSFFLTLEPINENWPTLLTDVKNELSQILESRPAFLEEHRPRNYEYEHLAVYFLYRYMLKSVFDGDLLPRIKLIAVSVNIILLLDVAHWNQTHSFSLDDSIEIAKNYSKEIEYCEENLESFLEESWQNDCFSIENLIEFIMM